MTMPSGLFFSQVQNLSHKRRRALPDNYGKKNQRSDTEAMEPL
jgi:hypothetical protein